MYSVLDVRVVKNSQDKQVTLIRLQNPWADAPEWNGRCSDKDDAFWTQEVKSSFNLKDASQNDSDSRFKHFWYQDDGIFCMMVEDVLEYFTQIVACRDYPENYFAVEYD